MKLFSRALTVLLMIFLIGGMTQISANAKSGPITTHIGTVDASSLRLRSKPSTTGQILDTAPRGDYVIITGRSGQWYKVVYDLTTGFMHQDYIKTYTTRNVELGYGRVTGDGVNIRSGPSTSHAVIAQANTGHRAYIIGFNAQWYKVIIGDRIGYIRSDFLELTQIPYENRDAANEPLFFRNGVSTGISPSPSALQGNRSVRDQIVANAKRYLGTPYRWGGNDPNGFDCSGFTRYVYALSGISIPRTTTEQVKVGSYLSKDKLRPGDLVFLQNTYRTGVSHVGIYIGDGMMIHASSSKGVTTSALSSSYYTKHYHSARSIV